MSTGAIIMTVIFIPIVPSSLGMNCLLVVTTLFEIAVYFTKDNALTDSTKDMVVKCLQNQNLFIFDRQKQQLNSMPNKKQQAVEKSFDDVSTNNNLLYKYHFN